MIDFFFSRALPKVTAHTMADLPYIYGIIDDTLLENDDLYRVVKTLEAAIPDGRWVMVGKVSDLIKAQPEILVMRNTRGNNLMHLLCANPFTSMTAVDIFLEGPSSIHDMFYEKNKYSVSPLMLIVIRLTRCLIHRGKEIKEIKEVFDAIVEKVREGGKHDVADDLLEIWRGNSPRLM